MSDMINIADAFNVSSGGTFLSKDDKETDFREQTPFYVMHVEPASEGQWGVQTIFHVKAKKYGRDDTKLLAFAHNEYRERLANNIKTLMEQTPGKPAGPIYLHKWVTKSGNEAWDIKPVPYTGVLLNKPAQPTSTPVDEAAKAAGWDDDNAPF